MHEIRTVEASQHVGEMVQLKGWLHNLRRLGGVNFIVLRDGWGTIQAVTEDDADQEKWRKRLQKPAPKDPWGGEWGYRAESEHDAEYDLWSNGPDKEEGTDDDIVSWIEDEEGGSSSSSSSGE